MNLVPLAVMNAILFAVTVVLMLAERLLVSYGTCTLAVRRGDERRELRVQGGGPLLAALTEGGVEVSSSCGGKGSCGYCKVRVVRGGGELLPTEEIYMSREERSEGMRLACQVKVKGDMEIVIPDFLFVVHRMALAKKFDPRKRWKLTIR